MPTIKDIAKAAGVSHGTVSNVLNGRGNVSVEKIKMVEEVAKQMGYKINAQARSLREGSTKTVSLILPNISSEQYNQLYVGINNRLSTLGYYTNLFITNDQKEREYSILHEIASNRDCAVVAVSCLNDADDYYKQLHIHPGNILFVFRQVRNAKTFYSVDFKKAGRNIAKKVLENNYSKVGFFSNLMEYSCSNELKEGFCGELSNKMGEIEFQSISSAYSNAYTHAFEFFSGEPLDVIITSDIEKARFIKNAHFLGSTGKCPAIYSLCDSEFLQEEGIYKYHMNYQLLGNEIAQTISQLETSEHANARSITIANKGFLFSERIEGVCTSSHPILNVLTLPSPSTEALKKLLPHFKKTTGIDIRLAVHSFEEIYDILADIENHQHYDIIRIDMACFSWFAHKTLKPLNKELRGIIEKYPEQLTDRYSSVNGIPYAIPLDPSMQMLFYRKDLLEDPKVRRMFYETYKRELTIPTTFEAFDELSTFFSKSSNHESPVAYGTCVTTGNTEIIASEFLLRYYAEGGQLAHANDTLFLESNSATKVLEDYMDGLKTAKNLSAHWWDESVSLFAKGNIAMIIVYMNLFSTIDRSPNFPRIGFSQVPGNNPLLGGGSLGISKYCEKEQEATQFFKWIYSNEIAEQLTLLGGSSVNDFVYNNQHIVEQSPWLKFAVESNYKGVRESSFPSGQPFNLRKVERIIGLGVKNAMNQIMTSDEAIAYINMRLAHITRKKNMTFEQNA